MYDTALLKHYSNSKKLQSSITEIKVREAIIAANVGEVEEEPARIMEIGDLSFLMLPSQKVEKILLSGHNIKGFGDISLLFPYTVDVLVGKCAVEVNGPYHYVYDTSNKINILNGITNLKKELVEAVGLKYVEIPYWEIDPIINNSQKLQEYVKRKLNDTD